jgi:hypothetical protein
VLGIFCGIIGTIQATEAIKIMLGVGISLGGRLLAYDSLKMRFHELRLRKDVSCPVCGTQPTITSYIDYEGFCADRLIALEKALRIARLERAGCGGTVHAR